MFNLVKYRYAFLIISLLVIIPGTISLFVNGLKVGIDFASGSTVEFRPQRSVTAAELQNWLKPFNLVDLQIVTGDNQALDAKKTVWVKLNTTVDSNVQSSINASIIGKYPEAKVSFTDVPVAGGKTFTQVTIIGFAKAPQTSDIQTLLNKLPNTSDTSKNPLSSTPSSLPSPAPTGTAAATPKATAAATPKATGTAQPTATGTPVVTPTPSTSPANIAVNVVQVTQGTTTETISILTRTAVTSTDSSVTVPKIQAAILNGDGPLTQLISNSVVGPAVATETTRNAVLAVLALYLVLVP